MSSGIATPADLKSTSGGFFDPTIGSVDLQKRIQPNLYFRNEEGRPATYPKAINTPDVTKIGDPNNNAGFNHFMMQVAEHFDPFIQKKTLAQPRFWHDRVPRGSYTLFQGTNPKTFIYRGGLTTYAGLSKWDPIQTDVVKNGPDPCGVPGFSTYTYAWETLQYDGYRTAWGSDPICVDALKYQDQAQTQLAWILETGAEFGVAIQEVWNRDTYIRHSVLHDRSFLMSKEYAGAGSARYVYDPFVKFAAKASDGDGKPLPGSGGTEGVADIEYISEPFIVFDASVEVEPLNFDTLERVGFELSQEAAEHAVGHGPDGPTFGLMAATDDMEKYFRGNEEYRKYWIEAQPQALIDGYGLRMKTFRGWAIVPDGNQLRFKVVRYISSYSAEEAVKYGYVGFKEFANKEVFIAQYVPPRVEGRQGINGSRVPAVNPDYYTAELAIAPVFMNNIITNLFVPQVTSLGSGTSFGAVPGLNGQWSWLNIVDRETNPFGKIGNFYGMFEIFQRPEPSVFYALSFLYRRCMQSLRSRCPAENPNVNMDIVDEKDGSTDITKVVRGVTVAPEAVNAANKAGAALVTFGIATDLVGLSIGAAVTVKLGDKSVAGAYVTRKTNSNLVEVALPIDSKSKVSYAAGGGLTIDTVAITEKTTGTITLA